MEGLPTDGCVLIVSYISRRRKQRPQGWKLVARPLKLGLLSRGFPSSWIISVVDGMESNRLHLGFSSTTRVCNLGEVLKIKATLSTDQSDHHDVTTAVTFAGSLVREFTSAIPSKKIQKDLAGLLLPSELMTEYHFHECASYTWISVKLQEGTPRSKGYSHITNRWYAGCDLDQMQNLSFLFDYLLENEPRNESSSPKPEDDDSELTDSYLALTTYQFTLHQQQRLSDSAKYLISNNPLPLAWYKLKGLLKLAYPFIFWVFQFLETSDLQKGSLLVDLLWIARSAEQIPPSPSTCILALGASTDHTLAFFQTLYTRCAHKLPKLSKSRVGAILAHTTMQIDAHLLSPPESLRTPALDSIKGPGVVEIRENTGELLPLVCNVDPLMLGYLAIHIQEYVVCYCEEVQSKHSVAVYHKVSGDRVLQEELPAQQHYYVSHTSWNRGTAIVFSDMHGSVEHVRTLVIGIFGSNIKTCWLLPEAGGEVSNTRMDGITSGCGFFAMRDKNTAKPPEEVVSWYNYSDFEHVDRPLKTFYTPKIVADTGASEVNYMDARQYDQALIEIGVKTLVCRDDPNQRQESLHFRAHLMPNGLLRRTRQKPEALGEMEFPRVEQTLSLPLTYHRCFIAAVHPTYVSFWSVKTYSLVVFFRQKFMIVHNGTEIAGKVPSTLPLVSIIRGTSDLLSRYIRSTQNNRKPEVSVTELRKGYPQVFGQSNAEQPQESDGDAVELHPDLVAQEHTEMFAIGRCVTRKASVWLCNRQSQLLLEVQQIRLMY